MHSPVGAVHLGSLHSLLALSPNTLGIIMVRPRRPAILGATALRSWPPDSDPEEVGVLRTVGNA